MMDLNFDATTVEPAGTFEPLPNDWYKVIITESEKKDTKNGMNSYLQLKMEVVAGSYQGRILFDRLNLWNSNQTASEIAKRTLSAICHATGVMKVNDPSELHDKPLMAKVVQRAAANGYEASNDIKGYEATKSAAPASTSSMAPPF